MSNFFIHKITVYHYDKDTESYTIEHFDKVYFRHNKKVNVIDKGFESGATGTIVIPTTETLDITTKDYVIEGNIDLDYSKLRGNNDYQVFRVLSVDDNRKGNLQHYKLGVSE